MGCVYFIKHNYTDYVKIGMSTNNDPKDRFNSFLTYAPRGGVLVGFIKTKEPYAVEKFLHSKYHEKKESGEWFKLSIEEIRGELILHEEYEDCIETFSLESIDKTKLLLDDINNDKFTISELTSILVLIVSKININTISGMARSEGKTPRGIKISSQYRKESIGDQLMCVKGLKDCNLPF